MYDKLFIARMYIYCFFLENDDSSIIVPYDKYGRISEV